MDIDLSIQITADRETATLVDDSVFGTRSDYLVFTKGLKTNASNDTTDISLSSDDPLTDASWEWDYADDGAYKFYYVAIPAYDEAETYETYDAVWVGDVVYRSLVDSNTGQLVSDTNYFEVIDDPAELAANKGEDNESLNLDTTIYLRVLSYNGQYWFGNEISEQCECSDCDDLETIFTYNDFARDLDAIAIYDSRSEILRGEVLCRKIESKYAS
jgi:hypothetical protein